MPRGSSPKREREYEELVDAFKDEGRYRGREKEVAARIVNKQRAELGETKDAKRKDRLGKSPDRGLPIDNYENLTVSQVKSQLGNLDKRQARKILDYERDHKNRKSLVPVIESVLGKK